MAIMFSFANKKTDLTSDNLEKLSYQSIQTPVVGAEKNPPIGSMLLHPQHVLNQKFIWKPNYNNLNNLTNLPSLKIGKISLLPTLTPISLA